MAIGLIGRKVGMTRIFTEDGVSIPVTVIEVNANRVTQVKTLENDGYRALQVTTGAKKATASLNQKQVTLPKRALTPAVVCGKCVWQTVKAKALKLVLS